MVAPPSGALFPASTLTLEPELELDPELEDDEVVPSEDPEDVLEVPPEGPPVSSEQWSKAEASTQRMGRIL